MGDSDSDGIASSTACKLSPFAYSVFLACIFVTGGIAILVGPCCWFCTTDTPVADAERVLQLLVFCESGRSFLIRISICVSL